MASRVGGPLVQPEPPSDQTFVSSEEGTDGEFLETV